MKKLLYLCLFPFLGISCMEDLGTYDYNPLHEITIDTLKNRTIEIYHQLEVEAKISFSGKETPLEYCWYRYTNNDLEVDTLSLEKKLVYNVNLSVGNYTIYLKVTDKETGLSSKSNFTLSVTGKFDKGLMVLGEVDGTPNLVFLNTAGNLVEVYGADNGHELGTHPVIVADASTTQIIKLKDMFILNGTSGGVTLNNADLTVSSTFEDLFYIAPQVITKEYIQLVMVQWPILSSITANCMNVYWELQTCWDTACNSIQLSRVIMNSRPMRLSMEETIFSTTTKKDVF